MRCGGDNYTKWVGRGNQSCGSGDGSTRRYEACLVSTSDSAHEQNLTLGGDRNPDKKLPYWAQVVLQMREEGIDNPVIPRGG